MLDDRQVPLIEHGSSRKSARNQLMVSRKINVKFSHFRIMTNNVAISVPNKLTTHNNAKYQKCALVASLALELNIELLYLPAYSPNLNLIERFWKFVKKNCLNSIYYKDFNVFSASICDLVDNAHTTHYEELSSLLSWNFQLYSEDQIKNAA